MAWFRQLKSLYMSNFDQIGKFRGVILLIFQVTRADAKTFSRRAKRVPKKAITCVTRGAVRRQAPRGKRDESNGSKTARRRP
jgi:hypothetical protein